MCVCLCVRVRTCLSFCAHGGPKRCLIWCNWSHRWLWNAQCGYWDPNLGSLQEQYRFLTSQPSPRPHRFWFSFSQLCAVLVEVGFVVGGRGEGERKLLTILCSWLFDICLANIYFPFFFSSPSPALRDKVLLSSTGWLGAHYVDQADFELPLGLWPWELGLQSCAYHIWLWQIICWKIQSHCRLSCAKHCSECLLCIFGLIITKWDLVSLFSKGLEF